MPPRFVYWTIVAGGLPTAFRAAERDELLPTFKRIQATHPDAEMKYFARGKLWASQEEARAALEARRQADRVRTTRGRDWRPGGEHRDPRQRFEDARKAGNLRKRKQRFERRTSGDATTRPPQPAAPGRNQPPAEKPPGDPLRHQMRPPARARFDRKPRGSAKGPRRRS